jgi:threonine/homoserine/homoserine lactone efflux protein
MPVSAWLEITTICMLGAMSPGPSLAIILREGVSGGLFAGVCASLSHALGIGLWAALTVFGLSSIMASSTNLYTTVSIMGALYLGYLGITFLRSTGRAEINLADENKRSVRKSFIAGFSIAISNPKAMLFFAALFSQFIATDLRLVEKIGLILLASSIDALWYVFVCILISTSVLRAKLLRKTKVVDRVMGALLLLLSCRMFYGLISQ